MPANYMNPQNSDHYYNEMHTITEKIFQMLKRVSGSNPVNGDWYSVYKILHLRFHTDWYYIGTIWILPCTIYILYRNVLHIYYINI